MTHQDSERQRLAALHDQIAQAEARIVTHLGALRLLRARRMDVEEHVEMLRIMVAGLESLKRQRAEIQAYLAFMERLIDASSI
jgi:hypothetical protein